MGNTTSVLGRIDAANTARVEAVEIAERGISRPFGADTKLGSKIQSITVVTPLGTVYISRK